MMRKPSSIRCVVLAVLACVVSAAVAAPPETEPVVIRELAYASPDKEQKPLSVVSATLVGEQLDVRVVMPIWMDPAQIVLKTYGVDTNQNPHTCEIWLENSKPGAGYDRASYHTFRIPLTRLFDPTKTEITLRSRYLGGGERRSFFRFDWGTEPVL